jgi:ubiquinone/menaquinone biosynthesis C-methylase UbiE
MSPAVAVLLLAASLPGPPALASHTAPGSGAALPQESIREEWQRVPDVLAALGAGPGSHVADVGSGDGFFSVRLARAVGPTGRVYAVDISADALSRLRTRLQSEGVDNVEIIAGETDDPRLPEATLDAALIVNAYHEMVQYREMLAHLRRALKPEGRLVIIEPITPRMRGEPRFRQVEDHEIAPWYVTGELREAGFHVLQVVDPFTARPAGSEQFHDTLVVALPAFAGRTAGPVAVAPVPAAGEVAEEEVEPDDLRLGLAALDELVEDDAVVLIDVRAAEAFRRGHLPGARPVPINELDDHGAELAADGRTIVAYCD